MAWVVPMFWSDTAAWSDDERICGLYLLTCEHRKTEGLYRLPAAYAAYDMAWTVERFEAAVAALAKREWLIHEGDWMFLTNGLRHNQPKGNQIKGAKNAVANVPHASRVYAAFFAKAQEHAPDLAEILDPPLQATSEPPPKGVQNASWTPSEASVPTQPPTHVQNQSQEAARERDDALDVPVVVAAPPALPPAIETACDTLAAAGLHVHDRTTVSRLAAQHPEVDIVEAAIRCANWGRGKRVKHPLNALKSIVEADDAPRHGSSTSGRSGSSLDHYRDMAAEFAAEEATA